MPTLVFGNSAPLALVTPDPKSSAVEASPAEIDNGRDDNWSYTTYSNPDPDELVAVVKATWHSHFSDHLPVWVDGDDEATTAFVARTWSKDGHKVIVGQPRGWEHGPEKVSKAVAEAVKTAGENA